MLKNTDLELLEKKYFSIICNTIECNIGKIISQVYSQASVIAVATTRKNNSIEHAVENIIEALIATQLGWNVCSMPVSADSCFECGDAIVHIDAKTVDVIDNDAKNNKVVIEASQTSYCFGKNLKIASHNWQPNLSFYENHQYYGEVPNLTYVCKIVYSSTNLVERIYFCSLPHGQLEKKFKGATILSAGKTVPSGNAKGNIRFNFEDIIAVKGESWRCKLVYERK